MGHPDNLQSGPAASARALSKVHFAERGKPGEVLEHRKGNGHFERDLAALIGIPILPTVEG